MNDKTAFDMISETVKSGAAVHLSDKIKARWL
jgi:hypothetical protein